MSFWIQLPIGWGFWTYFAVTAKRHPLVPIDLDHDDGTEVGSVGEDVPQEVTT
jgi:hypothetical protein